MDIEEVLRWLNLSVEEYTGEELSVLRREIITQFWEGKTYEEMKVSNYKVSYIETNLGPKLLKLLSEVTGKKITKKNLRIVLEEAMKERSHASPPQTPPPQVAIAHPSQAQHDQSFALPEKIAPVKNWVGRSRELDTLKSQIFDPDTRAITITAVCLVGLAGIGKTTLTSQLVRELQAENAPFTVAAWETLRSPTGKAPGFDSIIDSLLFTLSNGEISAATTQNDCRQKTEMLIRLLKKQSCLIVLDNVETVLQTGQASRTGYFGSSGFAVKTV